MATHPSTLAWRIPWTEEPGGLQSMGPQRVGHDLSDLACTGFGPRSLEGPSEPSSSLYDFLYMRTSWGQWTELHFSSVAQSCPALCDPMNCSTPGLPVHHQLPEFTQTHVHQVGDDIQPSHPLSSPSPPAPNPSQHQSLFQ